MKLLHVLIIALCIPVAAASQQSKVTIKVVNQKKEALSFATISVTPASDSTKHIQMVSDSNGIAVFTLSHQQYIVNISSVNYIPLQKGISVNSEKVFFSFTAQSSGAMKDISITATRPVMRQEDDKTIVDPENLAASSINAYEILEKIPGLFVDQDGNIYISSITPATVYINGREQKMSASDIATLLKNLPPNSISSIEILRTPSAKYDASGSGGIVNVVLKKGVKIGLTGSATAGGNRGKYNSGFVGFNINNNNGKVSTYLNLQYGKRNNWEQIRTDRIFAPDSLLSQDAYSLYPTTNYYTGFGINFPVTKKWELSFDTRMSYGDFVNTTTNFSKIRKISTNILVTDNTSFVKNKGNNFNISQGFSAKYKIDSAGSEWSSDLSYNYAPGLSNQSFTNAFTIPAFPSAAGDGRIKTGLQFFSGQTNVLLKLANKITVETGLKSTLVKFNNTTDYFRQNGMIRVKDVARTSAFHHTENINAAYLQASKNFSGIIVKMGTRLENTNMQGSQKIPSDTSFSIHRTDFFPYVYISRNVMTIMKYELRAYLVYRRTISRPGYQLLNPSQRFVDPYLFETGNPALRPQFTQNYEANVSVDERPILAIGLNQTKDIFTNVVYQADSSHSVSYRTYDNLGRNKEIYFRGLGAIPPGGKYFIVAGLQYNHNFYKGLYEGKPLSFKKASWTIFMYQQLKVTPNLQLTLNGFARFKGQLQFYELSSFGALNFSATQQLFKRKLAVSASINDIFLTNRNDFTIKQGSIDANGFRRSDSRRIGLNIRYNFGIRKKEQADMFNMDSPEKTN
jgi:hypothetical protein